MSQQTERLASQPAEGAIASSTLASSAFPQPLTPADVLRSLPADATPAQQDAAIQAHFPPKEIHWSGQPDTLTLPGIKIDRQQPVMLSSCLEGFFAKHPFLHPELQISQEGFAGVPLPYQLRTDNTVVIFLLLTFFLSAFAIRRSALSLFQRVAQLFFRPRRTGPYINYYDTDGYSKLILLFQTNILLTLLFFEYMQIELPDVFYQTPPYTLLITGFVLFNGYFLLKLALYSFANRVFFESESKARWLEFYMLIHILTGLLLFPVALLVAYFEFSTTIVAVYLIIVLLLNKLLLLRMTHQLFFKFSLGYLHLILYFCTLESLPLLAFGRVLVYITKSLTLSF